MEQTSSLRFKLATAQFHITADIEANKRQILAQMREAHTAPNRCDVIQFPECALSGYGGSNFDSWEGYDWQLLRRCTEEILVETKMLNGLWVVLGSTHPLSEGHKPHNSVYIFHEGNVIERYDKMFCAGSSDNTGDLKFYSSGNHFTTFVLNGVKCGVLICHDYRYPELYREYKKQGVAFMFHSYNAGNMNEEKRAKMEAEIGAENWHLNPGRTFPEITMPATMISYAANTYVWISCSNTSKPDSCWAAFVVRSDGVIIGRLEKNVESILVTEIDTNVQYYDSTKEWRDRSIDGTYHSGILVTDPRSDARNSL